MPRGFKRKTKKHLTQYQKGDRLNKVETVNL